MNKLITFWIAVIAGTLPLAAQSYVGPGAGLSLIGALWTLVVALFSILFFILAFPVRMYLRRHRQAKQAGVELADDDETGMLAEEQQKSGDSTRQL